MVHLLELFKAMESPVMIEQWQEGGDSLNQYLSKAARGKINSPHNHPKGLVANGTKGQAEGHPPELPSTKAQKHEGDSSMVARDRYVLPTLEEADVQKVFGRRGSSFPVFFVE
ncbi:unnamed protein product [Vicia faba]|uniref:Uncharacterized protein n=1 Tax=Vicia faba TaxID=3906 RepID=A0AAV0YQC0_VICFA|nr:unnamed protein product [Vicia faba]